MTRVGVALGVVLAVVVGLEAALVGEGHHAWGAFALAGLLGAVAITVIAKLIGVVLQRPNGRE